MGEQVTNYQSIIHQNRGIGKHNTFMPQSLTKTQHGVESLGLSVVSLSASVISYFILGLSELKVSM